MAGQALNLTLLGAMSCLVAGAIAAGLWLVGSPETERARQLDGQRINDLNQIARAIDCHFTVHGRLPESLEELSDDQGKTRRSLEGPRYLHCSFVHISNTTDPASTSPYVYRPTGKDYQLCALFDRHAEESAVQTRADFPRRYRDRWAHRAGLHCFTLTPHRLELRSD